MTDEAAFSTPDNPQGVEYREIKNCPGYCVGDDASIWSRRIANSKKLAPKWRKKAQCERNGYYVTGFPGGKVFYVHRIVLEAFVGPCPDGMECCHNDGNRKNNAPSNLRWDTPKENCADAAKHGTSRRGSGIHCAKLTDEIVRAILADYMNGDGYTVVSRRYNCTRFSVEHVINGKTWKHVAPEILRPVAKNRKVKRENVRNPLIKLTPNIVIEMRSMAAQGETMAVIGGKFGVSKATAHDAITGRTWSQIPMSAANDR